MSKNKTADMKAYMKEYNRKYYIANKDEILGTYREKVHCKACNRDINRSSLIRHNNSDYHLKRSGRLIKQPADTGTKEDELTRVVRKAVKKALAHT